VILQNEFVFSASSLQDFMDCPRRFYLRYGLGLAWPQVVTVPAQEREQHLLAGTAFHRMVQQHLAGVPAGRLDRFAREGGGRLAGWWEAYLNSRLAERLTGRRYVEFSLSTPFCGRRLMAKYDLLVVGEDGGLTIVDWKTSLRKPRRENLLAQAQTRVYRYVLAQAGGPLWGGKLVEASAVRMIYWFAEFPEELEVLEYDAERCQADGETLCRAAEEIEGRKRMEDFEETARGESCKMCNYSSYCERGGGPIAWEEAQEAGEEEMRVDFEGIEEIAF
jgi:CRISPR/Cas system-associated exonuclease Cas4 (RecB family)